MLLPLAIRRALFQSVAFQPREDWTGLVQEKPLVTVITPVYNGAAFLHECIQSVLAQSFENFEYLIVDNCSTDESLRIAEKAAATDSRISVIQCDEHVGPIQNWNRSLKHADRKSSYVKFVHADDWIFPDCLARMVEVAESDDDVGLVSAYRLEEDRVSLDQLPSNAPLYPATDTFKMNGQQVACAILRDKASVLGSPTSILIRSTLAQSGRPFFSEDCLHADKEACIRVLQHCDFGFVRQVLTFTRRHNESVTQLTSLLDTRRQENLLLLEQYGPALLTDPDFRSAKSKELRSYYDFLARKAGTGIGREFWNSHRKILRAAGSPFSRSSLVYAILRRWMNPMGALKDYIQDRSHRDRKVEAKTIRFLDASRKQSRNDDA